MNNSNNYGFKECLVIVLLTIFSNTINAKPEACTGITKKCTKDKTLDKTIGSKFYSCYECKQALCKDGGNGGLVGTATTSVCTEKATSFTPISQDGKFSGGSSKFAPNNQTTEFDEADALFGKRTNKSKQTNTQKPALTNTRTLRKPSSVPPVPVPLPNIKQKK